MGTLVTAVTLVGVVAGVVAAVVLVVAAYCFVEEAFGERPGWGLLIVLPVPLAPVIWLGGVAADRLAGWWFERPVVVFGDIGFIAGSVVAPLSLVAAGVFAARHWGRVRGYVGAMAVSAAYAVAWPVVFAATAAVR